MKHTKGITISGSPEDLISKLVNIENSHLIKKKKSKLLNSTRDSSDAETPLKKKSKSHRSSASLVPSPVVVKFDNDTSSSGLLPAPVKVKNEKSFLNLNIKKEVHSNTASEDELHRTKSKDTPISKKKFKEANTSSLISSLVNLENKGLTKIRKSDLSNTSSNISSTGTPLKKKKSKSDSANISSVHFPVNVKFENDKGFGLLPAPVKVKKEKHCREETLLKSKQDTTSLSATFDSPTKKKTTLYKVTKEAPTKNLISSLVNLENRGLTKRKSKSIATGDLSDGEPTQKRNKVKADRALSVPHPINVKFEGDINQDLNVGLLPAPIKIRKKDLDDQVDDVSGKYVKKIMRSRSTSSSNGENSFSKSKQTKKGLSSSIKGRSDSSSSSSENESDLNKARSKQEKNVSDSSGSSEDHAPLPKGKQLLKSVVSKSPLVHQNNRKRSDSDSSGSSGEEENQSIKTRLVSENIRTKSSPLKQRSILSNTNKSDSSSESEDSIPENKRNDSDSESDSKDDSQSAKTITMVKNSRSRSSPEKRSNIQTNKSESESSSDDNDKTKKNTSIVNNVSGGSQSKISPIKQSSNLRNTNNSESSTESEDTIPENNIQSKASSKNQRNYSDSKNDSQSTKTTIKNRRSTSSPEKRTNFQTNISESESSSDDNNKTKIKNTSMVNNVSSRIKSKISTIKQTSNQRNTNNSESSSESEDTLSENKIQSKASSKNQRNDSYSEDDSQSAKTKTMVKNHRPTSSEKRSNIQRNNSESKSSSDVKTKKNTSMVNNVSSRVKSKISPIKQRSNQRNTNKSESSSDESSTETKQVVNNIRSKSSPVKQRSIQKNVSGSESSSEDDNQSVGIKPIIKDAENASTRVRPSLSPVKQNGPPSNTHQSDNSSEDEDQLTEPKQENDNIEYERHFKRAENWIESLKQKNADLKPQTINVNLPLKHAKYSLFRIPKNIDPNQWRNLKCSVNKEVSVILNDRDYVFQPLEKNSEPILIVSNGLHLINLDKIVVLQKSEPLKVVKKIKVVQRQNIPLPDEIKQRHPLFGFDYKEKYHIKKEVKNKIQEAMDNKIRQLKKGKKHKNKVKKEKYNLVNDEQHVLDLLNLNNLSFGKPKGKTSMLNDSDNLVSLNNSESREKKHKKKKDHIGAMNNSEIDVSGGTKKRKRSHDDLSEPSKSSKKKEIC